MESKERFGRAHGFTAYMVISMMKDRSFPMTTTDISIEASQFTYPLR